MNVYFLFGISSVLGALSTLLNKRFQQGFTPNTVNFVMYNFVNALFGTIAFAVMSGGSIQFNMPTFSYSFLYAIVVIGSIVSNILSLSCMSVALVVMTSTAGSIIFPSLFGIIFLKEELTVRLLISLILMITATVIPHVEKSRFNLSFKKLFILFLLVFFTALDVVTLKLYTRNPNVYSTQSFFAITNIILIAILGIVLIFIKKPENTSVFKSFTLRQTGNIALRTLFSNIISVLTVVILTSMNISAYTVLSSTFGILSSALLSKFYFKEHMPPVNWIALLIAILAVAVNP